MAIDTTPAALRLHVHQLAQAFGVDLREVSIAPDEACAHAKLRVVYCHPVIDETTYAVALHELGHLIAPLGAVRGEVDGDTGNLKRIEEAAAWEWARHYALIWTDVMDHVARWAEGTYAAAPAATPRAAVPRKQEINWNDWR